MGGQACVWEYAWKVAPEVEQRSLNFSQPSRPTEITRTLPPSPPGVPPSLSTPHRDDGLSDKIGITSASFIYKVEAYGTSLPSGERKLPTLHRNKMYPTLFFPLFLSPAESPLRPRRLKTTDEYADTNARICINAQSLKEWSQGISGNAIQPAALLLTCSLVTRDYVGLVAADKEEEA